MVRGHEDRRSPAAAATPQLLADLLGRFAAPTDRPPSCNLRERDVRTAVRRQIPDAGLAPVALLLAVQDAGIDLLIDQLAYRLTHLPSRLRLDELAAEERRLLGERRRIANERLPLDEQLARLEDEVAECDDRTAAIERRLRTADAGSFRDQEAMSVEIASIAIRKTKLEDEELTVLELLEPLDQAIAAVEEAERGIDEARETTTAELAVEEAELARRACAGC